MRILMIMTLALAAPVPASAGELENTAAGAEYRFVKCAKPAEPDMTVDPQLSGRKLRERQNAQVQAYNVYVDGVNEYVVCLAAEAKADLEAYYAAVSARLDAEQEAISERADALRPSRGGGLGKR